MGDNGRRGRMQNLPCGPTPVCHGPFPNVGPVFAGRPVRPARARRRAPHGLRAADQRRRQRADEQPVLGYRPAFAGEAGENLKKVFAIGIRNSFGMAFDPVSGDLWEQENGDDTFDEINRVERGMNGGWV